MSDLLLELFSEEIPARMQRQAAEDLKRLVTNALVERGLIYEGAASFATPRRLALHIAGLPARQPDQREEKKGPRVGAPEAAIAGFLKSAGLTSLDAARIEKDKKGAEFYLAVIERKGAATIDILADLLPATIRAFPWPKSMRWGARSTDPDALRWVRPLHSIVATFGPETEAPEIVRFAVDGIEASDITRGHRFMAPAPFAVKRFDDYVPALERAKVVLDSARRQDIILHDAKNLAMAQGFELVEDAPLLEEVTGLVEWPVVLMGSFEEAFLTIPREVIRATIRVNQKCFVLKDGAGALINRFILVSNLDAADDGKTIVAGNERVIAARLSDAKFFYETDLKTKLEDRLPKLDNIVFHEKLGTQGERVERIAALAKELAPMVGAEPDKAARAAKLCKADLLSEMVGEFPELQGLMGRYYASAQGEDAGVAAACEDHYKPQGPSDRVPSDPVSIAVALADKIDTLVGFWAINEKPTGSKDPYALRRAALGVIRLVLENGLRFSLFEAILGSYDRLAFPSTGFIYAASDCNVFAIEEQGCEIPIRRVRSVFNRDELTNNNFEIALVLLFKDLPSAQICLPPPRFLPDWQSINEEIPEVEFKSILAKADFAFEPPRKVVADLLNFFVDRLKVYLRDRGARYDLIDAALGVVAPAQGATAIQDDLLMITQKVDALDKFLATEDGKNLLAGFKRAANILKAEEKKDGDGAFNAHHAPNLRLEAEEHKLAAAIARAREETAERLNTENFEGAMRALAKLREPVDAFFDKVTVNVDNKDLRANRLRLLNELRVVMLSVADFGKIAGDGAVA